MRIRRRLALVVTALLATATAPSASADAPPPAAPPSPAAPTAVAPAAPAPPAAATIVMAASAPTGTATSSAAPSASPALTAPSASPARPPTAPAPAAAHGAIVIAITDDAIPAARALARDVYADEALRPRIDDSTARVLVGEAALATGTPKLMEIAEVRKAAQTSGNDAVTRRLFASLGADLGAVLVIPVAMRDQKPIARILTVAKAAFEPVELSATIEPLADGTSRVKWGSVAPILATFLPKAAASPAPSSAPTAEGSGAPPGPLAAKKEEPARSFWTSPWTWAGIGVVVTAGVVVFAVSQSQGDAAGLHLQGRVSP